MPRHPIHLPRFAPPGDGVPVFAPRAAAALAGLLLAGAAAVAAADPPCVHVAHLAPSHTSLALSTSVRQGGGATSASFLRDVPCTLVPTLDAFARDGFPRNPRTDPDFPSPGTEGVPVALRLRLTLDLPAGHVLAPGDFHLLAGDADKAPIPLGRATLGDGAQQPIDLGPAQGLSAVRTRTDFRSSPGGVSESFRIALRNATAQRTVVDVVETFARGGSWSIVAASHAHREGERPDTAVFPVTLAPHGQAALSYTVEYAFPGDEETPAP